MMKLTLEGLQILDAISRRGSFAAAAEELFRVPSTITYAVQKLEEDLGVQVFERNGHRPRLTPAGEALLRDGRLILQAATDLEDRVRRVSAGYEAQFAIALDGLLPCAPLLELAREFYSGEEHAQTDLHIAHQAATLDALAARRADLAIGALGQNLLKDGRHHVRLIGCLDVILAASPKHPLAAQRRPLAPDSLRKHRLASQHAADVPVGQRTVLLPTLHARIAAVKAGFAASLVPRAVVERELQAGELVEVALERPARRESFYLAWDERPKGKAFEWWLERLDRPSLVDEWLSRAVSAAPRPAVAQLLARRN